MVSTLILLYALNANTPIPQSIFIVTWILAAIQFTARVLMAVKKAKDGGD